MSIGVDSQREMHTCGVGCYGSPATDVGGTWAHKSSFGRWPFLDSECGGVHADEAQAAMLMALIRPDKVEK
jgi:hypothetical protein